MLWHSNYGESSVEGGAKPELVAPSIWLAAPVLPNTDLAAEARTLFQRRVAGDRTVDQRIDQLKLITPHYQHVDGTSFAAPIVAGAVACMIEANPGLTPSVTRDLLVRTATRVPGAHAERQGAGALEAGRAVAFAIGELHCTLPSSPEITKDGVRFSLHDHTATRVRVVGSWDAWSTPIEAANDGTGAWTTGPVRLGPGLHSYKFLLDADRWIDDPAHARKTPDGFGALNSQIIV
jgi:serine protease AprX